MKALYQVYWNRHKNIWSVRIAGRVAFHANTLMLKNCKFKVNPKGREKCIISRVRNVHAYCSGTELTLNSRNFPIDKTVDIWYNPYLTDTFMVGTDPIYECQYAIFDSNGKVRAKV